FTWYRVMLRMSVFFVQAEDGIRDRNVTGVQTCALPIYVLLVLDGLGGGAGGHQAVEAGNRAAGHRDEEDREQVAQAFVVEAGVQIGRASCRERGEGTRGRGNYREEEEETTEKT